MDMPRENSILEVGESHQNLADALAVLLVEGRDSDFFQVVVNHCVPKWRGWLRRRYNLSIEDCDDCIYQVISNFEKRRRDPTLPPIDEPYRYIRRSISNTAVDLVRHYQQLAETQDQLKPLQDLSYCETSQVAEISEESAIVIFEGLFGDFKPDQAWVVDVVQTAISSLRPALQRVITYLLQEGLDYNSSQAPQDLGISPKTFRANKSNAYKELRAKIPEELSRRGIRPALAPVPEVIDKTGWQAPSADNEEES